MNIRFKDSRVSGAAGVPGKAELSALVELVRSLVFPEVFPGDRALDALSAMLQGLGLPEGLVSDVAEISRLLHSDADAIRRIDPAVVDPGEIILCYPGLEAMLHYRIAHALVERGVRIVPRMITEIAHSATGIDIHPNAVIGERFAIDHGTGVVIGATAVIGNNVSLYQGVTLGARNFAYDGDGLPCDTPRHPVLEDGVTVYANATILGRVTIGEGSVIGGNVWLTRDVPPHSHIRQSRAVALRHFSEGEGI